MSDCRSRSCRAVLVTAPGSGQGRTTATANLAAGWRSRGLRVRAFRTGPEPIDPTILERPTGAPVCQLDLWIGARKIAAGARTTRPTRPSWSSSGGG